MSTLMEVNRKESDQGSNHGKSGIYFIKKFFNDHRDQFVYFLIEKIKEKVTVIELIR